MDPKDASKNLDDAPENSAPPLVMGPFKFKEWVPNDHITLVRNDNFYAGKPNLDEWARKVYPDANAMTAPVKTGEIDVAPIEAKDFDDVKQLESVELYEYPNNGFTYIGWNELRGGKEFFQDKSVRQALAFGLDIDQVIDKILFGHGQKMLSHTPPTSWAFDPAGLNDYKYDRAKAERAVLAETSAARVYPESCFVFFHSPSRPSIRPGTEQLDDAGLSRGAGCPNGACPDPWG
jgi:peptide/nickel transport system substrate-binding protein